MAYPSPLLPAPARFLRLIAAQIFAWNGELSEEDKKNLEGKYGQMPVRLFPPLYLYRSIRRSTEEPEYPSNACMCYRSD